jgi:DNA polymerase bacteriophage-type
MSAAVSSRKAVGPACRADLERVIKYCQGDVDAELAVHNRLGFLPPEEREAWLLHQRMNERGLRLDLPYAAKCEEVVDKTRMPLEARCVELTGGLRPAQFPSLKKWFHARGVEIPSLNAETVAAALGGSIDATDEDDELEATPLNLTPAVREVLEILQLTGSSSVKKLKRMRQCVCGDGRARGLSQFHGAAPGRSTGYLLNPYNFPRGSLVWDTGPPAPHHVVNFLMSGDPDWVECTLGPAVRAVVSGLRHAIVPDPGNVFLSGDYAGIQARILLALSGQHDKAALMAAGADVYCDMAEAIYRRPIDKHRDPIERHVGKNSVLGLGFGMGWEMFKRRYGKHLSDEFCQEVVRVYRKEWAPCVKRLWDGLAAASLLAVQTQRPQTAYGIIYQIENGWLTARLPSGRKLWYWNPQLSRQAVPWDANDIRPCWSYQKVMLSGRFKTVTTFGGQLCENIVMGCEVDIHRYGWANAERAGFPIVLEVYDELVAEVPAKGADLEGFKQCLLDIPSWAKSLRIPVAVETWQGDRYRKG